MGVAWVVRLMAAFVLMTMPLLGPDAAQATPPLSTLLSPVTDDAHALGTRRTDVESALDRVAEKTDYQLFVVYVYSFDGMSGVDWADQTAAASHLGVNDFLLAVATQDRLWGFSVDSSTSLSQSQQTKIENAIVDKLRTSDWAGAAIAASNEICGPNVPAITAGVVGGAGVVGVGGWLLWKRKHPSQEKAPTTGANELASLTTAELDKRAGTALVALDNALRSSEDELSFARAEFGLEATDPFRQVLDAAQKSSTQAFAIRQKLDDSEPETQPQKRAMLNQLLQLCDQAAASLNEQVASFEQLRDLANRAGQVLDENGERADEVEARIPVSQKELETLATTYPATALASVSKNPDQATALVAGARDALAKGKETLAAGNKNQAVGYARVAQNAITQAVKLLDGVDSAPADLAKAASALSSRIASISADLTDVDHLGGTDPAIAEAAGEARAALEEAKTAQSGGDPLAALTRITAAETALDNVLAPARQEAAATAKALQTAQDTLAQARGAIDHANTYINAHMLVGATARTRLSDASRKADLAQQQLATDPNQANITARDALSTALDALQKAQSNVELFSARAPVYAPQRESVFADLFGSSNRGGYGGSIFTPSSGSYHPGSSWSGSSGWSGSSSSHSSFSSSSSRSSGGSFGGGGRSSSSSGGRSGGGHF